MRRRALMAPLLRGSMKINPIAVVVGALATTATLVLLFIFGFLGSRAFALGCMSVMIVSAVVYSEKWRRQLPGGSPSMLRAVDQNSAKRRQYSYLVVTFFLLVGFFWFTRGGPLVPRVVGASFFL